MDKNKRLILAICLFLSGIFGSALFAIGQSISNLAYSMNTALTRNNQNVCGILCFILLIVGLAGLVMIIKELVSKNENK